MNYTFVKFTDTALNIDYPWYAKICDAITLIEFYNQFFSGRNAAYLWSYLNSKEFSQLKRDYGLKYDYGDHCRAPGLTTSYYNILVRKQIEQHVSITPIIDLPLAVEKGWLEPRLKIIATGQSIYINCNGGWMMLSERYKITQTVEEERFPSFDPMENVKISKWENGKHYYVTLNGEQISVNGHNKWNTEIDAYNAAKEFFEKRA